MLFAWVWRMTRALRRNAAPAGECPHAARLAELCPHLTLVAQALSGGRWRFRTPSRLVALSRGVYLPQHISVATTLAENVNAYLYRVAYTVTSRQLGLTLAVGRLSGAGFSGPVHPAGCPGNAACLRNDLANDSLLTAAIISPAPGRSPALAGTRDHHCLPGSTDAGAVGAAVAHISSNARLDMAPPEPYGVLGRMERGTGTDPLDSAAPAYAGRRRWRASCDLWGQLLPSRNGRSLPLSQDGSSMPVAFPTGTELPGKPKEHVRRVELDQRDIANDVLIHTLDKSETAEEFQGVTRTPDGADGAGRACRGSARA